MSSKTMQQLFDEYLKLQMALTQCVTRMHAQYQLEESERTEFANAPRRGPVKQRVLDLLEEHAGKMFVPSAIARILRAPSDSVHVALHWLASERRVEKVGVGLYRARPAKDE